MGGVKELPGVERPAREWVFEQNMKELEEAIETLKNIRREGNLVDGKRELLSDDSKQALRDIIELLGEITAPLE